MDRERANVMLVEARAELTTARSSVTYLEQVVSGLEGLLRTSPLPVPPAPDKQPPKNDAEPNGSATPDAKLAEPIDLTKPTGSYPKSPEAITTILRSRPNQPMRFPAVWKQIIEAGLADPSIKSGINAYQNSARRLADNPASSVERDSDGRYFYRTDPAHETSESTLDLGPAASVGVSTS